MVATKPPTPEPTLDELQSAMAELQAKIETAREREAAEKAAAMMATAREHLDGIAEHIKSAHDTIGAGDIPSTVQWLNDVIIACQSLRADLTPDVPKKSGRPRSTNGQSARAQVYAVMQATPGDEYTATELAHETGRSSGQVANELRTLADDPQSGVTMTCDAPKKYTYTAPATDDATATE